MRCDVFNKEVTGYIFKSTENHYTWLSIDLCFDCRDKVFNFMKSITNNIFICPNCNAPSNLTQLRLQIEAQTGKKIVK